tara:strand:- start:2863 stop:3999 length:1137 start_codon:yes stop_codon:yes gene_type:complete
MTHSITTKIISVTLALMIFNCITGCQNEPQAVTEAQPTTVIATPPTIDTVDEAFPAISIQITADIADHPNEELLQFGVISPTDSNSITPILGVYTRTKNQLTFTPSFALLSNTQYQALDKTTGLTADYRFASQASETPVVNIEPNLQQLPANHLKFYLYFSMPMQQDNPWDHCKLLDLTTGEYVPRPFRHTDLWDDNQQRLTLWFHPGRQKTGVNLNVEIGPILDPEHKYELQISGLWKSQEGQSIGEEQRYQFTAAAADHTQPDPDQWKLTVPTVNSKMPLSISFGEPLDHALLENNPFTISLNSSEVTITTNPTQGNRKVTIHSASPWQAGTYTININPRLEDLAGNSIGRPFEVDLQQPQPNQSKSTSISFVIEP